MTGDEEQARSPFWLAFRVFDEPTGVFRELAARPRVLLPFILLVLVAAFAAFATPGDLFREQARRQIEAFQERGQITDEQAQERIERSASPTGRALVFGAGAVGGIVSLLVVALVLMFLFGTTSGTPVRFKEELAIVAHAYMPSLAGGILVVALAAFAGMEQLQLSLGFLVDEETSPFLSRFAGQLTFFGAWNVYLLALGNKIKTNWKGIGGPLLIVGGLWIAVKLVFAALGGLGVG